GFKTSPKFTLAYITRPDKAAIVSSQYLNDDMDYARQLEDTKRLWNKGLAANSRKYYHFIHSFSVYDSITPEEAHEITEKLCRRSFPDSEFVIATHTDTEHIHSHIVINSLSCITGKMLRISPDAYTAIKDYSNELAEECGLTTVDFRKPSEEPVRQSQAERQIILRGGTSWKQELCEVIDLAVDNTDNMADFEAYIGKYGVEIPRNTARTISFRHPEKKKAIRGDKLGANYTKAALEERLSRVYVAELVLERDLDDDNERARRKTEIKASLSTEDRMLVEMIEPYTAGKTTFMDVLGGIMQWCEDVQKRAAELKRRDEEARRRRSGDAR
ncbi:MAG: relaxase/mobilization nuclease domain-containing protein, partial [Oribacterium sp.]|nr:relaxase/mobilization nuclease domain-containing protein [Oribacterium sp.]